MRGYLDLKSKKKVDLLEKIFYSENHTSSQEDLLRELNITYPTLVSTIETINFDITRFGFEEFSIIRSLSNSLYTLNMSDNCSIQLIINAYIRESPKFQILELLLSSSFPNLPTLAKKLHVSYSAIKKDVKELNEELSDKGLKIFTGNGVEIGGDEFSLRLFYTFLFLSTYSGDRWPFSFIQYFEISKLLEKCPKEIYQSNSIDKSIMIHYYIAIHLLRDRMNCRVAQSRHFDISLYKAYTDEAKKNEIEFIEKMSTYLPSMVIEEVSFTTQILLSVILALGTYSSIEKTPSFFYFDSYLEKMGFMEAVDYVREMVCNSLSIPFSKKEEELLIYSLASINYRYFLLKNLCSELELIVTGYSKIDRNKKKVHKIEHIKPLLCALMDQSEMSLLNQFRENIISDYLIIMDKRIDFSKHTKPIRVMILSTISNETAIFDFLKYFSGYYNLEIVNQVDSRVDLYISDFAVSPSVLTTFRIDQPLVYVNTRWLESDYNKINDNLAKIAKDKFINNVLEVAK